MLITAHYVPIELVGFANSLSILAWPPPLLVVSSGRLTSRLFERQCCPRRCLSQSKQGLHMSLRVASSPRVKLCTYFHWFARPDRVLEPFNELPMCITKLRVLFHFRMGSHSLPVEQGRLARPGMSRHLHSCTFCPGRALGDERHCIFECLRLMATG